jgi:hypothetical protein
MASDEGKTPYYQMSPEQRSLAAHVKGWKQQAEPLEAPDGSESFNDLRERGLTAG